MQITFLLKKIMKEEKGEKSKDQENLKKMVQSFED